MLELSTALTAYSRIHIREATDIIASSLPLPFREQRQFSAFTFVFFFFLDSRAVGDFRAEFCNKPTARTSRPFGPTHLLLIHRVHTAPFFLRRKRSKSHDATRVQSLDLRGETLFCFSASVPSGSCPIQCRPPQKQHTRSSPEKTRRKNIDVVCRGRFLS